MQKEHFYNALSEPKEHLVPLRDELVQLSAAYPWFGVFSLFFYAKQITSPDT